MVLKTALVWTASVRPICYDFDLGVNSLELFGKVQKFIIFKNNLKRKLLCTIFFQVSSWSGSTSLKSMVMPLIDSKDCKNAVIIGVRSQITDDKFCGGWPEGL